MRNPLKMNINVRELSSQCFICEYSTGILWVFYGYSMGIESRRVDMSIRWKRIIC